METINFKVSARAGKLIGRENFSSAEGAIIELVKNSYDADANFCYVLLDIKRMLTYDDNENAIYEFDRVNSSIYIIDNGEGMTKNVISNHWMKIGTGNKENNSLSKKKRLKTGAKGIGRFALDRLGFNTEMWTYSDKGQRLFWEMDWKQFDNSDKAISDIKANIGPLEEDIEYYSDKAFGELGLEMPDAYNPSQKNTGTIIKVSNLKDDWYTEDIQSLYSALEALIPPKELKIPFAVYLYDSLLPLNYGVVETAFFNDYDYKIESKSVSKNLNRHI